MQIFEYNMNTQSKGKKLDDRSICTGHGSGKTTHKKDQEWILLDIGSIAVDRYGKALTAEQYGVNAICFCMGQWYAGQDATWQWVIVRKA